MLSWGRDLFHSGDVYVRTLYSLVRDAVCCMISDAVQHIFYSVSFMQLHMVFIKSDKIST